MSDTSQLKTALEELGLETHIGCRVPLLKSVEQEYGQEILDDVIRQLSDIDVMRAVHAALFHHGLID